jgi:hypothetical protein
MTTTTVDEDLIRALYKDDSVAKALLDNFAMRDRNSTVSKIDRLIASLRNQGMNVNRSEVIAAMRGFEKAGCGRYVEGRHGHPSRFEWGGSHETWGIY